MTADIRFTTSARFDITEAFEWYLERSPKAAAGLLAEINATLDRFAANPHQWPEIYPNVRRILVKRYPFALFIKSSGEELLVVAVFHAKRNPRKWRTRV